MPASAEAVLFLKKPVTSESLAAVRAEAAVVLESGASRIVLDIDDLAVLDSQVLSGLISLLRDVRERGGDVTLLTERKSLLDTLRITALDKVFTVEPPRNAAPEAAAPGPAPVTTVRRPRRRFATLAGVLFALASLIGRPLDAAPEWTADDVVHNLAAQNLDMQSFQAKVALRARLQSFPYISASARGTAYFKRPDNYEVIFEQLPSYAKGMTRVYTNLGDPAGWSRRFDLSVVGENEFRGHRDVVLELADRVQGNVLRTDVSVDPAAWHVDEVVWHYRNGGTIAMSQDFARVGAFDLIAAQHATIRVPNLHVAAEARYDDYQTNVAVDDAVFNKGSQ